MCVRVCLSLSTKLHSLNPRASTNGVVYYFYMFKKNRFSEVVCLSWCLHESDRRAISDSTPPSAGHRGTSDIYKQQCNINKYTGNIRSLMGLYKRIPSNNLSYFNDYLHKCLDLFLDGLHLPKMHPNRPF